MGIARITEILIEKFIKYCYLQICLNNILNLRYVFSWAYMLHEYFLACLQISNCLYIWLASGLLQMNVCKNLCYVWDYLSAITISVWYCLPCVMPLKKKQNKKQITKNQKTTTKKPNQIKEDPEGESCQVFDQHDILSNPVSDIQRC